MFGIAITSGGSYAGAGVPEFPDVELYRIALEKRILHHRLDRVRIASPFLLRTVEPPVSSVEGRSVERLRRVGKRVGIGLEGGTWLVLHLMIAGRLHWKERPPAKLDGRRVLAAFDFSSGSLTLTEAGSKKRASLHLLEGEDGLGEVDPGGLEVMEASQEEFAAVLQSRNHTLKRALTDPRLLSGIGNAYSDEILHRARLSPILLTQKMSPDQMQSLYLASRETLTEWLQRLRAEAGDEFPEKVTAFREGMAVHGRYGQPCPRCGAKVQRIRYASNETNYCAPCQTGGKLLADRALSRLLGADWPRTLEELESLRGG